MSKKLMMSYITSLGGNSSMSLEEPRVGLTEAEVRTTMDLVVTSNLFNTNTGNITGIKAAEIVTTTKETLI